MIRNIAFGALVAILVIGVLFWSIVYAFNVGLPNLGTSGNNTSDVNSDARLNASSTAVNDVLAFVRDNTRTGSSGLETAMQTRYGFTRQQGVDFVGFNGWTSGHGSCGTPNRDPQDPEYCMVPSFFVNSDSISVFVFDASGINFNDGGHLSEFVITDRNPRSVKDGGMLTVHSMMTEQEVALAIYSRLIWANRPGMTATAAAASAPVRSLGVTVDTN